MDLHNGLDIEVYNLRPTDLHYYYYYYLLGFVLASVCTCLRLLYRLPTQNMNDHRMIGDRSCQNDHDRPMISK